jgi:hypothetical protein
MGVSLNRKSNEGGNALLTEPFFAQTLRRCG